MIIEVITKYPVSVQKTIRFFEAKGLWYSIAFNVDARSCRDAANKRRRLGHTGINLSDELKSFFGKIINAAGNSQYIVIHCRGNDSLDFEKIKFVLNLDHDIIRLTNEELADLFHLEYGTVNPFTLDPAFLDTPMLQLFDNQITKRQLPPYTMMTNAGDLNYAVEFKPEELMQVIPNRIMGDIIITKLHHQFRQQKIGILTGNGPESGIFLWNEILEGIRQKLAVQFFGDISFPHVIIESSPGMGLSMELGIREKETWDIVRNGLISLFKQGATICCLACNTTQYFLPQILELSEQFKAKFVSIPNALEEYLDKNQINEFDFIGIKYVADFKKWSGFRSLQDKYQIVLPTETELEKITELAFKVKKNGVTGDSINKLRDLLARSTKTNNVVIALSEISLLMSSQKKNKSKKNFIDSLKLLSNAIVDEYISNSFLTEKIEDEDE